MPANPVTLFDTQPHPMGHEIGVSWLNPDIPPTNWEVIIFIRPDTDLTQGEVDTYVSNQTIPNGATVTVITDNVTIGVIYNDLDNAKTYYVWIVVKDIDATDSSVKVSGNDQPANSMTLDVIDVKDLVVEAVERVLLNHGLDLGGDIEVRKHFSLDNFRPPGVFITRQPGAIVQQYMGDLIRDLAGAIELGQVDQDAIMITWGDTHSDRRDILTNLFRPNIQKIKKYLYDKGCTEVRITMGGDGIHPQWQEGTLFLCSMTVTVLIESSVAFTDPLVRETEAQPIHIVGTP